MNCTVCGTPLPEDSAFCIACGAPVPQHRPDTRTCPNCGKLLPAHVAFCTGCGTRMQPAAPVAPPPESVAPEKAAPSPVCIACGAPLKTGASFCRVCGASQVFTPALMAAAKAGDQNALTELYNRTYNGIYYALLTFLKDEDAARDILQDSYIKAFAQLGTLQDDNRFAGWLKMIALNTARNYLRKKKPMLFSEMANDDGETSDPEIVEVNDGYQPEEALDAQEKKRLLWEIINSLSDEQRMVVSLFYFQEMSVADIAAELGLSEGTIKSRLNYGRKKIEGKVLALERQGTKLYGMAPMAFLLWLLGQNQMVLPALPGIPPLVAGAAAAGTTAGATAGTSAAVSGGTGSATVLGMSGGTGTAAGGAGSATVLGMSGGTGSATVLGMSGGAAGATATVIGMTGAAAAGATAAGAAAATGGLAVGAKIGIAALAIAVAAGGTTAGVVVAQNAGIGPWASSAVEEAAPEAPADSVAESVAESTPAPEDTAASAAGEAATLSTHVSKLTINWTSNWSERIADFIFNDADQLVQVVSTHPGTHSPDPYYDYFFYREDGSLVYGVEGATVSPFELQRGENDILQIVAYPTQGTFSQTLFDENGVPTKEWSDNYAEEDVGKPYCVPDPLTGQGNGIIGSYSYTYDDQGRVTGGSCALDGAYESTSCTFTCEYGTAEPAQTIEEIDLARGVVEPDSYTDHGSDMTLFVRPSAGLLVRSGPGSNYEQVDSLAQNDPVSIRGLSNAEPGWVYVAYLAGDETRFGWVAKEYLDDLETRMYGSMGG